jgi:hypothetical protein
MPAQRLKLSNLTVKLEGKHKFDFLSFLCLPEFIGFETLENKVSLD